MGLCTLSEVKAQLGKTSTVDDGELSSYIEAATATIESYCGAAEQRSVTEWHDVACKTKIFLLQQRAASIQSLTEYFGGTAYPYTVAADPTAGGDYTYLLNNSGGAVITRISTGGYPMQFTGPVKVVYTAGFATVPENLVLAAKLIVQHLWRTRNGGAELPDLSDEPGITISGYDTQVPGRALMLMEKYRRTPSLL